jgi:adenosylcobinamide-phosphate synthase
MEILYAIICGYILDLIIGDPHWLPHPVRLIGWLIDSGEKLLRKGGCNTAKTSYVSGMMLTLSVVAIAFLLPYVLLYLAGTVHPLLSFGLEAIMCYQILATKALKQESMKVYTALQAGNLPAARKNLSWIVGRDTAHLNPAQVTKGAVETVAENLSDGVIAPLLFMLLGGAPLGFLYKAINTLDSMIGYKNEKYLYFGRFAAKLDDVANYIPARISAILMFLAVILARYDAKEALRIYRRDRYNHTSPNSAHTEAVTAGALNIQLAGNNYYFGKLVEKPTIGDESRPVEFADIKRVNKLLYLTSCLGLLMGFGVRFIILRLI